MTVDDFVIFWGVVLIRTELDYNTGGIRGTGNYCGIGTVRDITAGTDDTGCGRTGDLAGIGAVTCAFVCYDCNARSGVGGGNDTGIGAVGDVAAVAYNAGGGGAGDFSEVGAAAYASCCTGRNTANRGSCSYRTVVDTVGNAAGNVCGNAADKSGTTADICITDTVMHITSAAGNAAQIPFVDWGERFGDAGIGYRNIRNIAAVTHQCAGCIGRVGCKNLEIIQLYIGERGIAIGLAKQADVIRLGRIDAQTGDGMALSVEAAEERQSVIAHRLPTQTVAVELAFLFKIALSECDVIHQHEMGPEVVAHTVKLLLGCDLIGIGSSSCTAGKVIRLKPGELLVRIGLQGGIGIVGSGIHGPDLREIKALIGALLLHLFLCALYGNGGVVTQFGVIQIVEVFGHVTAIDVADCQAGTGQFGDVITVGDTGIAHAANDTVSVIAGVQDKAGVIAVRNIRTVTVVRDTGGRTGIVGVTGAEDDTTVITAGDLIIQAAYLSGDAGDHAGTDDNTGVAAVGNNAGIGSDAGGVIGVHGTNSTGIFTVRQEIVLRKDRNACRTAVYIGFHPDPAAVGQTGKDGFGGGNDVADDTGGIGMSAGIGGGNITAVFAVGQRGRSMACDTGGRTSLLSAGAGGHIAAVAAINDCT